MRHLLVTIALAGCADRSMAFKPSLSEFSPPELGDGRALVGERFALGGWWSNGDCHLHHTPGNGGFSNLIAKHPHATTDGSWGTTCGELPVHIAVSCSAPCTLAHEDVRTWVTPTVVGPFAVRATLSRDDTGEVYAQDFTYEVVAADRVELDCDGQECGPEGVRAARPMVSAIASAGGRPLYRAQLLRINGRTLDQASTSLAELFPDARTADGGVTPGTYAVTVSFLDREATYQVLAQ
jgi:hypothetical protein